MRRTGTIIATVAVAGVLSAAMARAQAPLGFTIDPITGIRGTTVNGQVNPADVAANCNTTVPQLQAAFAPLVARISTDPVLCEQFFPGLGDCSLGNIPNPVNHEQLSFFYVALVAFAVNENFGAAAETALPQTFVMTFAELATQAPLGERGSFDPVTGVGSVVVPDLNPATYPVAATCVVPNPDLAALAIQRGAQTLQDEGVPLPDEDPNFDFLASVFELGPQMIVPLMAPQGLGVQFFTITTPTLGFTIDPTAGIRGTTVNGQVNPADVAAHCNTTVPQLQAAFMPLFDQLQFDPELCEAIYPGVSDCSALPEPTNYEQLSYLYFALAAFAVTNNFSGAADSALPQTFVMTFADLATQQPLGARGSFDPATGVGSVVVPDLNPGTYPVAATCVAPNTDLTLQAIQQGAQLLQDEGVPLLGTDPDFNYLDSIFALGPQMLVPMMSPRALGVQFFTITTPTLGFTIDPTAGLPGDTVNGQVNPADVAAHCNTTLESVQAAFEPMLNTMGLDRDLCEQFFPGLFDPNGSCAILGGDISNFTYEQMSYVFLALTSFGVNANLNGAADLALQQTFVMTFADLLTQQPLGERGSFDPVTGVGSVVVPNLTPGIYPVAATCVAPNLDLLVQAVQQGAQTLQEAGLVLPLDFEQLFEAVFEFGPQLIVPMMSPRALGVQFFNILADVDHFQCYRARSSKFNSVPVTLSDRFGNRSVTVRSPIDLCAPANKNGEDPEATGSPDFLTTYKLSSSGPFQQISGLEAENQFGTVTLNVKSPKVLMVPSAISPTAPPASPDGAFLNHFTCYDVRVANAASAPQPGIVTVQTAFETAQVQPQKPKRLCVPTSKNGEPVIDSRPENLLCYKAKSKGGLNPAPTIFLANQFGSSTQRLGQRREICIPTSLTP